MAARKTTGAGTKTTHSPAKSNTTTDHETIRRWAEERGGQPAVVRGTGKGEDVGILRLDFPGYAGEESLERIEWDDWFEKFDEQNLALVYQEQTAGGAQSNFNKLVKKEKAQIRSRGGAKTRTAGGES